MKSTVMQNTFSIIKPDIIKRHLIGSVIAEIEAAGLIISAQKMIQFTQAQAEAFYYEHACRPFFGELTSMITSTPVVIQVLHGPDAIKAYRQLMGATNPIEAAPGTIRAKFGQSIAENSVHGSDSEASALYEISLFFSKSEIFSNFS